MALPQFVLRSYGGGANPAQLVETIGPTDTSFAINTTTGWTEESGAALGTSGPFVTVLDRFTDTVEKILCSGVNLSTGVVSVWTSGGSGRGYDGTDPQGHSPGSVAGVQTTWKLLEAYEANLAVFRLLGGSPTTGQLLAWNASGYPYWAAPTAGVTGVPAGRMYYTTTSSALNPGTYQVNPCSQDFAVGGVTYASAALTVPTTGKYDLSAQVVVEASAAGQFDCIIERNGSTFAAGAAAASGAVTITPSYNGIRTLTAADVITFFIAVGSGTTGIVTGGASGGTSELSLTLVSA